MCRMKPASDTFYSFARPYPEHYPLPRFIHVGQMRSEEPWHYATHEEPNFEWFLLDEGSVRVAIDGIYHEVGAGDMYLVQPGQTHRERGVDHPVAFSYLKFTLHDFRGQVIDLFPRDSSIPPVARDACGLFQPYFQHIVREVSEAKLGCEQIVEATILQMIWELRRHLHLPVAQSGNDRDRHPQLVDRVNAYIRDRLDDKVTLGELASHCSMSTAHFGHVFRAQTGLSPMQYLLHARMDYALTLMNRHPDWSLAQVAVHVGFGDPLYFSRQFKRVYGYPPSEVRGQSTLQHQNLASLFPELFDPDATQS